MDNVDNDSPKFRPFASPSHKLIKVKKAKYSTSLDPRGYIPVYEYTINNQPIMWDRESGYVHFTGIWKSLGNSKADIVKMVDSNPDLKVKKIRGGFLKIQGTWIPYEFAYTLCRRTAWNVRKELVPIFGPRFPMEALDTTHPEYGCLLLDPSNASHLKSAMLQRRNSFTTLRQVRSPYKRDYMRRGSRDQRRPSVVERTAKADKVSSSMSLAHLLNRTESEYGMEEDDNTSDVSMMDRARDDDDAGSENDNTSPSSYTNSTATTPSPTFRVVPTFPFYKSRGGLAMADDDYRPHYSPSMMAESRPIDKHYVPPSRSYSLPLLSPLPVNGPPSTPPNTEMHPHSTYSQEARDHYARQRGGYNTMRRPSEPRILRTGSAYSYCHQNGKPSSPQPSVTSEDIIETINATILLQRLSQDDGARPFRPRKPDNVPSKVIVDNQEFKICWD
ncbi:hypothetical protein INT43_001501 [Umbelopsis isabellina]|uniref:HTH APSES-type domain-containing protein n=1 Tax=Mortierella isabellina TaxID=91625 RepID=A0A8H7PE76_MORIS|nr:hypothetical protein INT43_001501 [Umbelopsis isabellina]